MSDSDDVEVPEEDLPPQRVLAAPTNEKAHRAALIATLLVLILVLAELPFALRSMVSTLFGEQERILYDLKTDSLVPPVVTEPVGTDQNYVNIAVVNLDPATGQATFAVSGTIALLRRDIDDLLLGARGSHPAGAGRQRRPAARPAADRHRHAGT
jgi:hypothetical protein